MNTEASTDSLGVRHVHAGDLPLVLLVKLNYHFYPIGLAYVAAALRDADIAYDVLDLSVTRNPDWPSIMGRTRYTAVAAGGLFGDYLAFTTLFSQIRAAAPEVPLVLGGAITWDIDPAVLLEHIPVDFLVVGEGEITLPELIHTLASGHSRFEAIPGLVWRTGQGSIARSARRPPLDLTARNWMPDWDIFDFYKFQWMSVLTGRGCTGNCTFCSPTNGRFRARPVDHIMEEIERDNARHSFGGFGFHTEILFPDAETTLDFCAKYKRVTPKRTFGCLLRVDFPLEVLPDLYEAGCRHIHIGVESGTNRVLDLMKKRTTVDMVRTFMAAAKKIEGLTIRSSIMFGNYGEKAEDIDATVDLACELGIRQNTMLVLNYPGTLNYRRAKTAGLVQSEHDYLVNMTRLVGEWCWDMISKHNNGEAIYPNISAMDTPSLLKKTEQGLRRFYTQAHRARVVRTNARPGPIVEVQAACPFCGKEHSASYDPAKHTALNMDWVCSCANDDPRPIYVPAFDLPVYGPHMTACARQFAESKRIAILLGGGARKADLFLWTDRIGLDFEKIVAFVETPILPRGWISNYRILPLEEVRALKPDLYLVPYDMPRNLLQSLYGDSSAWALPDADLCRTSEFSIFQAHLGTEIISMLPFDAQIGAEPFPLSGTSQS
ncbi:MAG: radical SAM protein [Holophaga sp.]|nr:radical SAM protein [Holophaga sp.]